MSLCLFINGLYAQHTIFDFKKSDTKITKNQENTQVLDFRKDVFINKLDDVEVYIPFALPLINQTSLDVTIKQFSVVNENHTLMIEIDDGQQKEEFNSELLSYYVFYKNEIIGMLLYFDDNIIVTYKYNNRQFEINSFDDEIVLFDVNDCINKNSFSCAVEEKASQISSNSSSSGTITNPDCIELAIEIDEYTRNTLVLILVLLIGLML